MAGEGQPSFTIRSMPLSSNPATPDATARFFVSGNRLKEAVPEFAPQMVWSNHFRNADSMTASSRLDEIAQGTAVRDNDRQRDNRPSPRIRVVYNT